VVGTLEQNMYVGMFDWSASYHVTGTGVAAINYYFSVVLLAHYITILVLMELYNFYTLS